MGQGDWESGWLIRKENVAILPLRGMNSFLLAGDERPPAWTFQRQNHQTSMEIDVRLCQ